MDSLFSVYISPSAIRWVDDGNPIEYSDYLKWSEVTHRELSAKGYGLSALILKATGRLIGFCGLVHPGGRTEPKVKNASHEEYWGYGYALESVLKECGFAFQSSTLEQDGSRTLLFIWNTNP